MIGSRLRRLLNKASDKRGLDGEYGRIRTWKYWSRLVVSLMLHCESLRSRVETPICSNIARSGVLRYCKGGKSWTAPPRTPSAAARQGCSSWSSTSRIDWFSEFSDLWSVSPLPISFPITQYSLSARGFRADASKLQKDLMAHFVISRITWIHTRDKSSSSGIRYSYDLESTDNK